MYRLPSMGDGAGGKEVPMGSSGMGDLMGLWDGGRELPWVYGEGGKRGGVTKAVPVKL